MLEQLLSRHLESLLHSARRRDWDTAPFSAAAERVRDSGFVAGASLPGVRGRYRRDLTAHAWGVISALDKRMHLAVRDQSGRELHRVDAPAHGDWHSLRAGLHKVSWLDKHTVELQPRQRDGRDLGPRLRIEGIDGTADPTGV